MRRFSSFWCVLVFFNAGVHACQVPVFRYALERWAPDSYAAVVFHRGPLGPADAPVVELLQNAAGAVERPANVIVDVWDLAAEPKAGQNPRQPPVPVPASVPGVTILAPPAMGGFGGGPAEQEGKGVVWSGPLDMPRAQRLLDSPVRRELARRLLQGDAAVWLVLESGDAAKDTAAVTLLESELKALEKELALPDEKETDDPMLFPGDRPVAPGVPLLMAFSVCRVSQNDPAEDMLVAILKALLQAPGKEVKEPVAFAVFGRGRMLGPVTGEEFTVDVVRSITYFLAGACSCQVKELNPGVDLLMAVDWEGLLAGSLLLDEALPPLTGVMPEAPAPASAVSVPPPADPPPAVADDVPVAGKLLRNVVLLVVLGCLVVAGVTLALRRKGQG